VFFKPGLTLKTARTERRVRSGVRIIGTDSRPGWLPTMSKLRIPPAWVRSRRRRRRNHVDECLTVGIVEEHPVGSSDRHLSIAFWIPGRCQRAERRYPPLVDAGFGTPDRPIDDARWRLRKQRALAPCRNRFTSTFMMAPLVTITGNQGPSEGVIQSQVRGDFPGVLSVQTHVPLR